MIEFFVCEIKENVEKLGYKTIKRRKNEFSFSTNNSTYIVRGQQPERYCFELELIELQTFKLLDKIYNIPSLDPSQKRWQEQEECVNDFLYSIKEKIN